ncbi:MAG: aspartate-semialdehyde dehydrogenase [Betaproteobacteria bacterium]
MGGHRVAVVGATGAVGQELLHILEEREFPVAELKVLASARSVGREVEFTGERLKVEEARPEAFAGLDLAFFAAGGSVSEALVPEAVKRGTVCIDNTSAFRLDPQTPLVVPEVNPEDVRWHRGIIANPNCSTIIMCVALYPLHQAARVKRVVVSTYQAVSGAGAKAMETLRSQSQAILEGRKFVPQVLPYAKAPKHYPIAFNLIPQIDVFAEQGYTKEEWKMVKETQKIMHAPEIAVTATTVRVPVFRCHSESVNVETERKLSVEEARRLLSAAPGVVVMDDPAQMLYPMPDRLSGKDEVFVGRVREDLTIPCGLNLWVVGDQIRKGAALNAIQIAELLDA